MGTGYSSLTAGLPTKQAQYNVDCLKNTYGNVVTQQNLEEVVANGICSSGNVHEEFAGFNNSADGSSLCISYVTIFWIVIILLLIATFKPGFLHF
jgi:hypothetical protein